MIQRLGTAFDRCKPYNVVSLSFENYTVDGIEKLICRKYGFCVSHFLHSLFKVFEKMGVGRETFRKKFLFPQSLIPFY